MGRLLENVTEGGIVGGMIGGALDALTIGVDALAIGGATLLAGPVGFAAATTVAVSKAAVGTAIGMGAGVVKTIKEDIDGG